MEFITNINLSQTKKKLTTSHRYAQVCATLYMGYGITPLSPIVLRLQGESELSCVLHMGCVEYSTYRLRCEQNRPLRALCALGQAAHMGLVLLIVINY